MAHTSTDSSSDDPAVEPRHAIEEQASERIVDRLVDEHALDAETVLPGLRERPARHRGGGPPEIRVRLHDHRGVGSELHRQLLDAGLSRDLLTGLDAAGERDEPYPRVGDEHGAQRLAVSGQHIEPSGREARVHQIARQPQRRQRAGGRGLHDHGIAGRQRRPNLVRGDGQRIVERRDRDDDADGAPDVSSRRGSPTRGGCRTARSDR